ncbi:MAG: hypothetical protein K1X81_11290 [Bacteroidia bacterium]|nr:hypothetical protein [Bacteroidia bacterium]
MKSISIVLTFFLLPSLCIAQTNFTFSVEQVGLPNGHFSNYKFDGFSLVVLEGNKRKESRKLNQTEISQIDSVIKLIRLDTLVERYYRQVFDGVHRTFEFDINGVKKKITLNNYYLKNLDIFIRKVNSYLDERNRLISFEEKLFNSPDTALYYLPDFYIDTFDIPEHYNFYRVMCFREGYLETEILDSIQLCDCRIYPIDINSVYRKRHYWRAFRLENYSWRRDYFNNENQVFRTEYVVDIIPFNIVKEVVYTRLGVKPSVVIYRYYKTITKLE